MRIKKLYSALFSDIGYPFNAIADNCTTVKSPTDIVERESALIVWGGADIDPNLYGHKSSKLTSTGGVRDFLEWNLMCRAKELGIPIIGVCRGAQMLCALAGGSLYQHTTGHAGRNHLVETYDGEIFTTNSIHHQMLNLSGTNHELLAWSKDRLSDTYIVEDDMTAENPPEKEPEFVFFPDVLGFAIQWHPEVMDNVSLATQYILKEIYARCAETEVQG